MARAAGVAGAIIVGLMLAGTIPAAIDNAWLWSLLALFLVALVAPRTPRRHRHPKTD